MTPARTLGGLTVCVVAHTHWDREWYHAAPRFRQQLVALVDTLVANAAEATAPFLLDGQAIVLEDYLDVRPDRAAQLGAMLRRGTLEAGPWYVLSDGLIPSGEALVRNLLAGRRVLRRFGADVKAPPVAYCPDTFGHASAIPMIAQGFGFSTAIVWRGYGGAGAPRGDTARWQSDDGSQVLLYHLPPDGYETGSALPRESARMHARWKVLRSVLGERSSTGVVLLPNGADHHALQPDLGEALSTLRSVANADVIVRESLGAFADRLVRAAQQCDLPVVVGELRDSYGYTWTLGGTYGTRANQKRANARAERALLRDVEPWLVLAWLHGGAGTTEVSANSSVTLAQAPALLGVAWRTLLRAHPHDTLCGCSIDAVARAMDEHVASARAQARGLRAVAVQMALQHDAVVARSGPLTSTPSVVVRNRVARWRGGVAHVLLDETLADVPVGPSTPAIGNSAAVNAAPSRAVSAPVIGDLVVQRLHSRLVYRRRESPQHYPDNDLVREHRALVWMPPVPPLGLAVRGIGFEAGDYIDVSCRGTDFEGTGALKNDFDFKGMHSLKSDFDFKGTGALKNDFDSKGTGALKNDFDFRGTGALNNGTPSNIEEIGALNNGTADGELSLGSEPERCIGDNATILRYPFRAVTAHQSERGIELSNGRITVLVSEAGVRIVQNERTVENALLFETTSDIGDSYTPAIRGKSELLRIMRVAMFTQGPLRAGAKVWFKTIGKQQVVRVQATLSLDVASDTLRVDIRGDNQRRDHRLRVKFNSDVLAHGSESQSSINVWADAAFGPVLRAPLNVRASDQTREMVPPTMPMHRWATLVNAEVGATLHADGLAEVEADRETGALSLTLLRAIGELSRNNLVERPGHAGWPAPIPLAQSTGKFRAQVGLQLHGAWSQQTRDDIELASDALLLPLTGGTMRDLKQTELAIVGPALAGVGLRQSAVCLADDGDGIVLRCVNDSFEASIGGWSIPNVAQLQFAPARLDETLLGAWQPLEQGIEFSAPPRAVVTFRVRRLAS